MAGFDFANRVPFDQEALATLHWKAVE